MAEEKVPGELGEIKVKTLDGDLMSLGELWAKEPVMLVFIRHFG